MLTATAYLSPTPPIADVQKSRRSAHISEKAHALASTEIDFIPNPEFRSDSSEDEILGDASLGHRSEKKASRGELPKDLPAHLARLCEASLLTASEEQELFRRMNYCKYRANALRTSLDPDHPSEELIETIERYLRVARETRDQIVEANMRLVISVVKKFVTPHTSFDDLLSDGTMTMMNAVDKFDYDRGFRFSTYAYRSIARSAYRVVTDRQKEITRFGSGSDEHSFDVEDEENTASMDEKTWDLLRGMLSQMLEQLDRRERFIIRGRYALGSARDICTFQALADKLGVSKERVRQLEQRAVAKLRSMAAELHLDDLVDPVFSN